MPDPQDTSTGTVSMIFGILSCLGIAAGWGSIIAIITGYMARGTAGEGNGRIGRILGWITLCLPLILVVVWIILVFTIWGGVWWPWIP
ncbi:MAG: hypothetical protein FK733_12370 [Asgard group archaeon]|nr:hypothetical protein [Asgard group archaeon]